MIRAISSSYSLGPAKDARQVIAVVIIKHKLCLSDEETIAQIQENIYLQYFVGLSMYQYKPIFTPTLFVEIRKRMGSTVFKAFEQCIINAVEEQNSKNKEKGIHYAGKSLGRSKKETLANKAELKAAKKQCQADYVQCILIEGKFGQGKSGYGLNRIKAKTAKTSYAWINSIFLVMNLLVLLRSFLPSVVIYDLIRQLKIQIGRYYDDGNQNGSLVFNLERKVGF